MIRVEPFQPWHFRAISLQPAQAHLAPMAEDDVWGENVAKAGPGYTAMLGDIPLAAAGICPQWDNRAMAWAVLSSSACLHMLEITRAVRRFLDCRQEHRIEAQVKTNFEAGHRWARMLGFKREGTMRAYCYGEDFDLYARIREAPSWS